MLRDFEIRRLIEEEDMIMGYRDLDIQLQPAGFDLTLFEVQRYIESGAVDFDNSQRVISKKESVEPDESGWYNLDPGIYFIIYNEITKIPNCIAAIARPRSSMLRNAATVETAVWDPGYQGRSGSMLKVNYPISIKQDARVAQLIFYWTRAGADYDGEFNRENI